MRSTPVPQLTPEQEVALNAPTCPYTGDPLTPDYVQGGWVLRGGFNPATPFLSEEDAYQAFRRRRGAANAVKTPTCAYTGKPITLNFVNNLYWPVGEFFRPSEPQRDKNYLLWLASFRNGRSKLPHPPPDPRVESITISERPAPPPPEFTDITEAVKEKWDEDDHNIRLAANVPGRTISTGRAVPDDPGQ